MVAFVDGYRGRVTAGLVWGVEPIYAVLQGRNGYTGTGSELANDPKVIELYLG